MSLKFSKQSFCFSCLIYYLVFGVRPNDPICVQFQQCCVEVAKEQWISQYLDFDYVIENLRKQNKKFYNFGKISSADKNIIYRLIWNRW